MIETPKRIRAFELFDKANEEDPNKEDAQEKTYAKELLYAIRMSELLNNFEPTASEALQLSARCQHICRWEIPRESYEMNRVGYLKWREALKKYHAQKASFILKEVGYDQEIIDQVTNLILKKQLKNNEDTNIGRCHLFGVSRLLFRTVCKKAFRRQVNRYPSKNLGKNVRERTRSCFKNTLFQIIPDFDTKGA
jgi:hypothetical protein